MSSVLVMASADVQLPMAVTTGVMGRPTPHQLTLESALCFIAIIVEVYKIFVYINTPYDMIHAMFIV